MGYKVILMLTVMLSLAMAKIEYGNTTNFDNNIVEFKWTYLFVFSFMFLAIIIRRLHDRYLYSKLDGEYSDSKWCGHKFARTSHEITITSLFWLFWTYVQTLWMMMFFQTETISEILKDFLYPTHFTHMNFNFLNGWEHVKDLRLNIEDEAGARKGSDMENRVQLFGYLSTNLFENLIFFMFVFLFIVVCHIFFNLVCCRNNKEPKNFCMLMIRYFDRFFNFRFYHNFMLLSFLPFTCLFMVQLWDLQNTALSGICWTFAWVGLIFYGLYFLFVVYDWISSSPTRIGAENKVEDIYNGIRNTKLARSYIPVWLFRRYLTAILIVSINGADANMACVLIIQFIYILYLLVARAHKCWFNTIFELFNELVVFTSMLVFISLLESDSESTTIRNLETITDGEREDRNEVINYFWLIHILLLYIFAIALFLFEIYEWIASCCDKPEEAPAATEEELPPVHAGEEVGKSPDYITKIK